MRDVGVAVRRRQTGDGRSTVPSAAVDPPVVARGSCGATSDRDGPSAGATTCEHERAPEHRLALTGRGRRRGSSRGDAGPRPAVVVEAEREPVGAPRLAGVDQQRRPRLSDDRRRRRSGSASPCRSGPRSGVGETFATPGLADRSASVARRERARRPRRTGPGSSAARSTDVFQNSRSHHDADARPVVARQLRVRDASSRSRPARPCGRPSRRRRPGRA